MLASQRVFGVDVVAESGRLPVHHAVTRLALIAKLAIVTLGVIVLAMTGHACACRFLIVVIPMATCALHVRVPSFQREFGLGMVELRFLPAAFSVTVGALRTQRTLVGVVLAMAHTALH